MEAVADHKLQVVLDFLLVLLVRDRELGDLGGVLPFDGGTYSHLCHLIDLNRNHYNKYLYHVKSKTNAIQKLKSVRKR